MWFRRRLAAVTASTTTSVSTVRTMTLLYPFWTASSTCRIILVSASSCVQGARADRSLGWLHFTSPWCVLMICLSAVVDVTLVERKAKSSVLFWSMRRNCCQLDGSRLDGSTLLRMPFPRLLLVSAFRLSGRYSSHTTSTRLTFLSCDITYGVNTSLHGHSLQKSLQCRAAACWL